MRSLFRPLMWGLLLAPLLAFSVSAVFIEQRLDNPQQEERAREISAEIRCLVCQNQSILDSNADLAKDLRQIVRERIALGENDEEVRGYLVTRYGDWVLLDPPFKLATLFLWLGPVLIFVLGAIAAFFFLRGRNRQTQEMTTNELTAEEEAEISDILNSDGTGRHS